MAQSAKIIDITQSYVPVDPKTFPENLLGTNREDFPADVATVVPYDGYNFLPTSYGYRSYFGTGSEMAVDALPANVDKLLILQDATYQNVLIALCDSGIWLCRDTSWVQEVFLTVPVAGEHKDWSYALIENTLYCYRAEEDAYYKLAYQDTLVSQDASRLAFNVGTLTDANRSIYNNTSATLLGAGTYTLRIRGQDTNGQWSAWYTIGSSVVIADYVRSVRAIIPTSSPYVAYELSLVKAGDTLDPVVLTPDYVGIVNGQRNIECQVHELVSLVREAEYISVPAAQPVRVVPTFLNMAGQRGIFSAGSRLGFWDSANSIAWSSIDDLSDFTPSLQTLAGSAIFNTILGRITTCVPHGEGFIIYSAKSIIWVRRAVDQTFQWDSDILLSDAGIAYPEEVVATIPDTTHFAYTNAGIIKIEEGRLSFVLPEFYDYIKQSKQPVFMSLLQGRFLCFQILDKGYMLGSADFVSKITPPSTIVFKSPEELITKIEEVNLTGTDKCQTVKAMLGGSSSQSAASAAAGASSEPPDPDENPWYYPVWTMSYLGVPAGGINPEPWVGNGCVHMDMLMWPTGKFDETFWNTPNNTNNQLGGWPLNIDAKIALAMAIISARIQAMEAYVAEVSSRTYRVDGDWGAPVYFSDPATESSGSWSNFWVCEGGRYPTDWVGPQLLIHSTCHLEVFAQALSSVVVKCAREDRTERAEISPVIQTYGPNHGWKPSASGYTGGRVPSIQEACYIYPDVASKGFGGFYGTLGVGGFCLRASDGQVAIADPLGGVPNEGAGIDFNSDVAITQGSYHERTVKVGNNFAEPATGGVGASMSVHFTLAGWNWVDKNGNVHFVPSDGQYCLTPSNTPQQPPTASSAPGVPGLSMGDMSDDDGFACGEYFEPVTLPGYEFAQVTWPEQTVTLPPTSFTLQMGSIGPVYPTFVGAYVYDTQLKKWGKYYGDYKLLVNYSPINEQKGDVINYNTFGIEGGILDTSQGLKIFDKNPTFSKLVYGKIGYYRLGMTNAEEVHVHFSTPSSGVISVEGSLDGKSVDVALVKGSVYNNSLTAELGLSLAGKWFNVAISGNYDITHVEFRGTKSGRR